MSASVRPSPASGRWNVSKVGMAFSSSATISAVDGVQDAVDAREVVVLELGRPGTGCGTPPTRSTGRLERDRSLLGDPGRDLGARRRTASGASWTTTHRPVFLTEPTTAAVSSGQMARRSIDLEAEMPSASRDLGGLERDAHRGPVRDDRHVVAVPRDHARATSPRSRRRRRRARRRRPRPCPSSGAFGSRKSTGSGEAIACWIIEEAVLRRRRASRCAGPAVCAKSASGLSEWCSTAPMPPPYGTRMTTGRVMLALGAVVHLRELRGDLVEAPGR